jgi:hypothetical protein
MIASILGIILISFVIIIALLLLGFFLSSRPRLNKLKGSLEALMAFGQDGAQIHFVRGKSERALTFDVKIVGGVKQLYFYVDPLKLDADQRSTFEEIVKEMDLKIGPRRGKARSRTVCVGSSAQRAEELARRTATEIFHWTSLTRFRFQMSKFVISDVKVCI